MNPSPVAAQRLLRDLAAHAENYRRPGTSDRQTRSPDEGLSPAIRELMTLLRHIEALG